MAKPTVKKSLIGVVGVSAAAILYAIVPEFEGTILRGYLDPVGIPTKCMGDTTDVVVGKRYTEEECRESLEKQLTLHADPVLFCTPILRGHPYQLAAAVSFAYNVGANAYCKSSTARYFNAGDFKSGCRALNTSDSGKLQWVTARGEVLPGLVKRRAKERELCERGL